MSSGVKTSSGLSRINHNYSQAPDGKDRMDYYSPITARQLVFTNNVQEDTYNKEK